MGASCRRWTFSGPGHGPAVRGLRARHSRGVWGSVFTCLSPLALSVGIGVSADALAAAPPESPQVGALGAPAEAGSEEARFAGPPRVSGVYLGMGIWPALSWAFSPNLEVDQRGALGGGGGSLRLGQAVFPWMTLGLDADGGFYFAPDRVFMNGGAMIEAGFYPWSRRPLSLRVGFGFGAGLMLDDRSELRGGVGGPKFMAGLRYEFFPRAAQRRAREPGGWMLGPEIGWRGFTPAAKGRPMSNTVLIGVCFGYYWGK